MVYCHPAQVVAATEALSKALSSTEQLAAHESTSSLQLLPDQRDKLVALSEVLCIAFVYIVEVSVSMY